MNSKEFKTNKHLDNDMRKRFDDNTEFGREFINPFSEIEESFIHTDGNLERKITNNRQIKHKK